MTRRFVFACLVSSILVTTASAQYSTATQEELSGSQGAASLFTTTEDLRAQALPGEPADVEMSYVIPAGTDLTYINSENIDGTVWARFGVEDNAARSLPEELWIAMDDIANAELSQTLDEDPLDEFGLDIDIYSRKAMTYCYRYVKKYLLAHGMVPVYLPGESAWMAAGILPKYGFKKTGRKPSQAIIKDVCVYKGGPSGHGHIEIKLAQGWYYGYGYKKNPIANRIFIGCFHK